MWRLTARLRGSERGRKRVVNSRRFVVAFSHGGRERAPACAGAGRPDQEMVLPAKIAAARSAEEKLAAARAVWRLEQQRSGCWLARRAHSLISVLAHPARRPTRCVLACAWRGGG